MHCYIEEGENMTNLSICPLLLLYMFSTFHETLRGNFKLNDSEHEKALRNVFKKKVHHQSIDGTALSGRKI